MKNENIFVQIIKKAIALTREACHYESVSKIVREIDEAFKHGQKAERERILEMIHRLPIITEGRRDRNIWWRRFNEELKKEVLKNDRT